MSVDASATAPTSARPKAGLRHGYVYQEDFLSPAQIAYWAKRIPKEIKAHGHHGTVLGNEGVHLVNDGYRRSHVTFLNPYAREQSRADAIQARHLLYMLLGFAQVAEGTHLDNLGADLRYSPDDTHIQLACYAHNEKYDWHQDQASKPTGRQISIVVTVGAPKDGGQLEFRDVALPKDVQRAINTPGGAVAFPSWAQHCVSPVIKGQRISITSWITGTWRTTPNAT